MAIAIFENPMLNGVGTIRARLADSGSRPE
jgi:hypothetical protein